MKDGNIQQEQLYTAGKIDLPKGEIPSITAKDMEESQIDAEIPPAQ
mgnify:CR=1 FL=1